MLGRVQPIHQVPFEDFEVRAMAPYNGKRFVGYFIAVADIKLSEFGAPRSYFNHGYVGNIGTALNRKNLKVWAPVNAVRPSPL